jgi:Phasin protein
VERINLGQWTMTRTAPITSPQTQNLLGIGANQFESLMAVHKRLLDTFEQVQRDRLTRTMEETKLASEFAAKVASARSIPDVMALYQQWIMKCEEMMAEDGRKFLDDSQKVANAALSLLSNGEDRT